MNKLRFWLPILSIAFLVQGANGQTLTHETLETMMRQIRRDKFDHVLPRAMRDNHVDMWVHVVRDRNPDPIARDLGGESGVFIFTDRGGERIERAVLGATDEALWEDEAYDVFRRRGADRRGTILAARHWSVRGGTGTPSESPSTSPWRTRWPTVFRIPTT